MIHHLPAGGKMAMAGIAAAGTGIFSLLDGVVVDGSRFFEIVVGGALTLIGALLYAAWQDLKKRDDDAKNERRRLFQRLDAVNVTVARITERLRMGNHDTHDVED